MTDPTPFMRAIENELPPDRLTVDGDVATVHPAAAVEAATVFQLANRLRQQLYIRGSGSTLNPTTRQVAGLVLVSTDRLNMLSEVAREDFYVVVGAGFPLRDINRQIHKHHLSFPHANLPYAGTVGGAIAVGLSADHDGHNLPLKRFFVRAEIVTPTGDIISPGSACFKSVSGYDVVKIFAGAWGLLGLIATATLRVVPSGSAQSPAPLKMNTVDRENFLSGLDERNTAADAVYSRKIKDRFDPDHILPII